MTGNQSGERQGAHPKSTESKWKSRLGEPAMIVVSILLAFWIDAWWQGLEEARANAMRDALVLAAAPARRKSLA